MRGLELLEIEEVVLIWIFGLVLGLLFWFWIKILVSLFVSVLFIWLVWMVVILLLLIWVIVLVLCDFLWVL